MERFDVSEGGRFAEMVDAAERGETVEITRGGEVVAEVNPSRSSASGRSVTFDLADWEAFWRTLPAELLGGDAAGEVRRMRDEERF